MLRTGVLPGVIGCVLRASALQAQADLDAYVAQIRTSGMSELAAGELRTAAAPLAGASKLRLEHQGDVLYWNYEPTLCFLPGADAKTRLLREKVRAQVEGWVTYLRRHADSDHSGFVSTEEGRALRRAIERGLAAAAFGRSITPLELSRLLKEDAREVTDDLAVYATIREAALRDGMEGMPPLP